MLIDIFFHYVFYSSAVLIYGIALNRTAIVCEKGERLFLTFFITLVSVVSTVLLSRPVIWLLLAPVHLSVLYPFFCVLIQTAVSGFCQILVGLTAKTTAAEFSVSFLSVILALNESLSAGESVAIAVCSVSAFYALIPLFSVFTYRNERANPAHSFATGALFFLSAAVLTVALEAFGVSWLTNGAIQ